MLDVNTASTTALIAAMIEAMPEPVLAVAGDGRVMAANRHAKGVLPALRIGGNLALALRDPDILDAVDRVYVSGHTEQVSWRDRVPVERVFDVTVAPLDRPGEDRALVLTLRDLTEALRVERMRADFVANASHELRTPLASLLGFVETLQGPARDDARARERFLSIMADQARRMARLIDDLLSLSRIEQNLHLRPDKPIDLALTVRHVAETLAPLASESGVTLAVDAPVPVIVAGERDEILRVVENLVENAIKYGAAPGRVEIGVGAQRRIGVLKVRDFGAGIAPEHLPRLTERFYRIDAGQSRAKGGTGLGLAIVKHIVARHRGRLTIDSDLGHGTLITVTIPLKT
ncbi:ATP-binding protein [Lichenibacterium ramalinae]|uniref:histidine kinase n=1 Tax=Lichenibacterium ramalinae TaxID=2316527 RepID=A0A4Q2R9R3_9HYPH|nr:ATP-binding protein [Lichenibacterium ramalinae]RYB02531.1 two-component sensor histidine kinase [Lichenibacterium ramalinae]